MPESTGIFEKVKLSVAALPLLIGPALGSTAFAEGADQGYSAKTEHEIEANIDEVDTTVHEILGEDNCSVTIYDYLRHDGAFPRKRSEISDALTAICPEPKDKVGFENSTRLIESYMKDISDLEGDKSHQADLKHVTSRERWAYGLGGFTVGAFATNAMIALIKRPKKAKNQ